MLAGAPSGSTAAETRAKHDDAGVHGERLEGGRLVRRPGPREVDVVSQDETVDSALANLREALELYFEPPGPATVPELRHIEVEVPASEAATVP